MKNYKQFIKENSNISKENKKVSIIKTSKIENVAKELVDTIIKKKQNKD
jgi:hypothetical protein